MKCRSTIVLLLWFLTLASAETLFPAASSGQGAPEPRILSGTVYYAGGNQPAENISVELHSPGGSLIAPITTSSTGWFEFRGLRREVYVLAINTTGFEPVNFSVDLSFNSSRGNVIYLAPRSNNSSKQPPGHAVEAHELSMPQKARDAMESGKKKLYENKDAEGALGDFQAALALASDYYEAHYQMAMAYLTLKQRDSAVASLRKAIELSSDKYGEADIGLGTTMLDEGDFSGAEKTIRRGIELSPEEWLGHYELGRTLLNENRIEEAEKSALLARSLAPKVPLVYRLLSNLHLREKNYPALVEDIDTYLKLDPDSPAAARAKQIREEAQKKIAEKESKPAGSL